MPFPTIRVSADAALEVCTAALTRHQATEADALIQARQLLEAEIRGHSSHGLLRLPLLVARLKRGLIVSGLDPTFTWTGAALAVDGRAGFGPVVAGRVLDELFDRVLTTGVAAAAIRNSHHLGMLAPYVERIAEASFVGVVMTTSEALVHPWGGRSALIGTNPIGIGVPSASGAVSLDMSTSAISAGKIIDHAERGVPLPIGTAVDASGNPTTDAVAARSGAISPFGGAKGYALGLALEALVGLLSRTAFGTDVHGTLDSEHPTSKGDIIIVLSPAAFGADPADPALEAYLDRVRASGVEGTRIPIPGDRARAHRARRIANGIDIDRGSWERASALAGRGVSA